MNLRLAALYGRDPGILQTAAELLSLRGVYPTTRRRRGRADRGRGHGHAGQAGAPPAAPVVDRVRSPDARVRRVHRPSERRVAPRTARVAARRHRGPDLRRDVGDHLDLPGDVHDHDGLGLRDPLAPAVPALRAFYADRGAARAGARPSPDEGGEPAFRAAGRRSAPPGLALSIAIPAGFLAYAIHVHQKFGITWVTALGLLVALSVVTAAAVYGSRR